MVGRIKGLCEVLKLDKWTSKCTVNNTDVPYTLYIAEDVARFIDRSQLPPNITVIVGIPVFDGKKKIQGDTKSTEAAAVAVATTDVPPIDDSPK
jgi:hypothetical protein